MEVTKDDYLEWRANRVTVKLFESLKEMRDAVKDEMSNETVIMGDKCQLTQVRSLGLLAGLDIVLNMECDELVDEPENIETEINSNY